MCPLLCTYLQIHGAKLLDELALFHKPSRTLILTDTAFNFDDDILETTKPGWLFTTYLTWFGGFRPCCMTKTISYMVDPGKRSEIITCQW